MKEKTVFTAETQRKKYFGRDYRIIRDLYRFAQNRLSENVKFKKFGIDIKGLVTRKSAKIPILGQPVKT